MKISFNFDTQTRSFSMLPEDTLELVLMDHLADMCQKGARLEVKKIVTNDSFLVEMRVNGKEN